MNIDNIFPSSVASYIREISRATKAPESFVVMSVLASGTVVSGPLHVQVRDGHIEYGNLYLCIVAPKGWAKSPVMRMALIPLCNLQTDEAIAYERKRDDHEAAVSRLRGSRSRAAMDAKSELEACEPQPNQHMILTNGTMEGMLNSMHQNHRRGWAPHILLAKDELRSLFGEMDAYRQGKGGDMEKYLSLYNGSSMITRNMGRQFTVPNARLSVIGGIQPEIFKGTIDDNMHENGLFDRMIYVVENGFPPSSDLSVSPRTEILDAYSRHMTAAFMDFNRPEGGEGSVAIHYRYSQEQIARLNVVCAEYQRIGAKHNTGAFKKWETNLFKLSVTLAAMHRKARMDDDVLDGAIELNRYFVDQWVGAFRLHEQDEESMVRSRFIEWIRGRGDAGISDKDIHQSKFYRNRKLETRAAIESLIESGCIIKDRVKTGGKPSNVYFLVKA